jgi:hypothetical protein
VGESHHSCFRHVRVLHQSILHLNNDNLNGIVSRDASWGEPKKSCFHHVGVLHQCILHLKKGNSERDSSVVEP